MNIETMTADELEGQLKTLALQLHVQRTAQADAEEKRAILENEWKAQPDVKAVFEAEEKAVEAATGTETILRKSLDRYYELTGKKAPNPALQVRVTPTPEYDHEQVVKWFTGLFTSLFSLNKPAFNAWVKTIVDDDGLLPPLGDHRIPAILVNKPSTAILSAGLKTLAAEAEAPTPQDTLVIPPVTINGVSVDMGIGTTVSLYVPSDDERAAVIASTSAEIARIVEDAYRLDLPAEAVAAAIDAKDLDTIPF